MKQQGSSIIAGIDIGSTTTRVVIAEHTGNGSHPRVLGAGKSETAGISRGYVIHEEEAVRSLVQAIKMAEKSADIRLERAYVCMGGVSLETHLHTVEIPITRREVHTKDLGMMGRQATDEFLVANKNKSVLHAIPVNYRLDGEEVFGDPVGMAGGQIAADFSLVTCLTQHRDGLVSVVGRAGIDIIDIIASPIAAGVVALSQRARTAGSAIVDIGSETLTIAVFERDALVNVAVVPCGASLITNDLALGLQISLDEAEIVKYGRRAERTTTAKRKVYEIIEARIMDMLEIIQKRLHLWSKDRLLPGGMVIIGGGSNSEHIDTIARDFLKLPVQTLDPSKVIPSKRDLDASWFSAYGICMLGDESPEYRTTGIALGKMWKDARGMIKDFLEHFLP